MLFSYSSAASLVSFQYNVSKIYEKLLFAIHAIVFIADVRVSNDDDITEFKRSMCSIVCVNGNACVNCKLPGLTVHSRVFLKL